MIPNVPSYSQFLDVKDKNWSDKTCGIVCLKMLADYFNPDNFVGIDYVLKKALEINAFIPEIGWKHKELASLASEFSLSGKNYDWAKEDADQALIKLNSFLKNGPVMASIWSKFNPETKEGHLIVVKGIDENIVFINDPAAKERNLINQEVNLNKFLEGWKKRIVVISRQ